MISTLDRIESLGNSSVGMIEEQRDFVRDSLEAVSYTHLTLPTILLV